jgi:hypothetical protein
MRLTNRMPSCRGLLLMRIVGAIAFTNAACGGSNQQTCTQGTEGCHCGANSTCNTGLTCASNTCVNLGGAGGASGAAGTTGAAGSGATAGASGGNAGGTSSTGTGGASAAGTGGTAAGGAVAPAQAAAQGRAPPTRRPIPRTAARAATCARALHPNSTHTVRRAAAVPAASAAPASRPVCRRHRSRTARTTAQASARPASRKGALSVGSRGWRGGRRTHATSFTIHPQRLAPPPVRPT